MFRGKERSEIFVDIGDANIEKRKEEEARAFYESMDRSSSSSSSDEDDNVDGMELEDFEDDNALAQEIETTTLFKFPKELNPRVQFHEKEGLVKYDKTNYMHETFPDIDPDWLKGIEADEITIAALKRSIAGHDIMPMPVYESPVFLYIRSKTDNSWRPQVVSAIMSLAKLKQIAFGIMNGCIPYHHSVQNETPEYLKKQLAAQLKLYSDMHDKRLETLFKNSENESMEIRLQHFVSISEEYTFFYIHTYERFIFQSVIEPHNNDKCELELENMLTDYRKPESHSNVNIILNMQQFFQLKTLLYQARDCHSNYGFNMDLLPKRLQIVGKNQVQINCPPGTLYRGYIDTLTIYEYFRFLDVDNHLEKENSSSWNPENWRIN